MAAAQPSDPFGGPIPLAGPWKAQPGDLEGGSDPTLDDSGWATVEVPGDWKGTVLEDHGGYFWLRRTLRLPPPSDWPDVAPDLALSFHNLTDVHEVYVGGQRVRGDPVGAGGAMPPDLNVEARILGLYPVPKAAVAPDGTVVLAVRGYRHEPRGWLVDGAFVSGRPEWFVLGRRDQVEDVRDAVYHAHLVRMEPAPRYGAHQQVLTSAVLVTAIVVVGLVFLLMFAADPERSWELLLFALSAFGIAGNIGFAQPIWMGGLTGYEDFLLLHGGSYQLGQAAGVLLSARIVGPPRWTVWAKLATIALASATLLLGYADRALLPVYVACNEISTFALLGYLAIVIAYAFIRRRQDALAYVAVMTIPLVLAVGIIVVERRIGLPFRSLEVLRPLMFALVAGLGFLVARRYARQVTALRASHDASRRFVPAEFLSRLGHREVVDVGRGEASACTMTVLFADIRGFTTLSEQLGPEASFAFLNEYHAAMEPVIREEGGFINQYYGDGIMALFDDADGALRAALGMREALHGFNEGRAPIDIGIGLHTGEVILGTIGGATRLDTGVIGDAVNTASRIESLTKEHGRPILLSSATRDALAEPVRHGLEEIATVVPTGKSQPVKLYAPAIATSDGGSLAVRLGGEEVAGVGEGGLAARIEGPGGD